MQLQSNGHVVAPRGAVAVRCAVKGPMGSAKEPCFQSDPRDGVMRCRSTILNA
ncbi:hypothetical protein SBD_6923 [Streptomyces bottropensis ATCC 25435]|uniref:Uncharacterized protein n=1 Tax=Streptomyces bottropensis ATCC 25435 TaxID=1054862 RepID=M3EQC5_9ACTN|nr:hypothetical protein SBD_6923 [Streptomyces bottropensis ATCC 25435]